MKFSMEKESGEDDKSTPDSLSKASELVDGVQYCSNEKQAGVRRIEAVSRSWTKTSLIIAYVGYVVFFATQVMTMKLKVAVFS